MATKKEIVYQYVKKILHIRLDHLGDLILSTPLLQAMHDNWPDKEIYSLVTPYNQEVVRGCPYVNEVILYSDKMGYMQQIQFFMDLRKYDFDMVIAHSPTMKSYVAAYFTGAMHRIGIYYEERPLIVKLINFLLTDPIPLNIQEKLKEDGKIPHEVEKSFMLAEHLGLTVKNRDTYLVPDKVDLKYAVDRLKKWNWKKGRTIFGIHISEKWFKKGWTIKHFYNLAGEIQRKWDKAYVLFTYGSREGDIGREIAKFYEASPTVECAWDLSVKQWAAIIKVCSFFVTMDTGAVHVAASQKVPVAVIYDSENYDLNTQQFAPWRVKNKKLKQTAPKDLIKDIIDALADLEGMY